MSNIEACTQDRFLLAKKSYATRRVPTSFMATLIKDDIKPRSGDLILARVEKTGHHPAIELESGRKSRLFVGDEIILAFGNRYAPDQYEALIPETLSPCHMVAAGGIAATVRSQHSRVATATQILPLGFIGDLRGSILNMSEYRLPTRHRNAVIKRPVYAIVGSSMNAGKTESAARLIRGMTRMGLRVGAAKVTGTGAGGDVWSMQDAGARPVFDFTDIGMATTYLASSQEVEGSMRSLIDHLHGADVDAIVLEVADGIFQRESSMLLTSDYFRATVNGVIFASTDALGAYAGVQWLRAKDLPLIAVTGVLTSAPLGIQEAIQSSEAKVIRTEELSEPEVITTLGISRG